MAFLKCEEALKYFAECINFQTNLPCCIHFQSKWNARQCHARSRTWQWKLQVLVTVKSPSSIFWQRLRRCNHHGAVTTMPLKHRPPRLLMHPLTSWVEHARNQWMELSELLCYPASAFFCIHPFCLQYHSSSLKSKILLEVIENWHSWQVSGITWLTFSQCEAVNEAKACEGRSYPPGQSLRVPLLIILCDLKISKQSMFF